MLIKEQVMLFEMSNGQASHRPVFSLVALTANKNEWKRKQTILSKAEKLKPGKRKAALLEQANGIISGGTLLTHNKCVLMSARGKHSPSAIQPKQKATQKHYDNRTRNLQFLPSDSAVKVHFDTITHFNDERVIH